MPFPKTVDELRAAGYHYLKDRKCLGKTCGASLQIWKTPTARTMPLEVDRDGNVVAHFTNCPDLDSFRK